MSTERSYRFSLTAAAIEKLLLSIGTAIQEDNIVYDYTLGGTEGKVAAASAVKDMWLKINEMVTGEGLKNAINAADDSNVFTDAYKKILDQDNWKFIGSPVDIFVRDDIDTSNFTGGEVILLQKNDSGNPEFQYWKRTTVSEGQYTYAWESVYDGNSRDTDITMETVGTAILKAIPKSLFHMVEFRIHIHDTDLGHWYDVDGKIGYRGEDLVYSLYNQVNTKELVTLGFSMDEKNVNISVTSLQPNLKCFMSFIKGY